MKKLIDKKIIPCDFNGNSFLVLIFQVIVLLAEARRNKNCVKFNYVLTSLKSNRRFNPVTAVHIPAFRGVQRRRWQIGFSGISNFLPLRGPNLWEFFDLCCHVLAITLWSGYKVSNIFFSNFVLGILFFCNACTYGEEEIAPWFSFYSYA